eukprot:3218664-Pyramimonas_sp.AAC.1
MKNFMPDFETIGARVGHTEIDTCMFGATEAREMIIIHTHCDYEIELRHHGPVRCCHVYHGQHSQIAELPRTVGVLIGRAFRRARFFMILSASLRRSL